MENLCDCETVGKVARDGKSTCMQCGGVDAYRKLRISECGCRFKDTRSNDILICKECGELM